MGNIFLDEVVLDGDLAEPFQIIRSTGQQGPGGWQTTSQQIINVWGVVSVAGAKDMKMLPEGDQVSEARSFHSNVPMYVTRDNVNDGTGLSDQILWKKTYYKVLTVADYSNRNYYKAIAVRLQAA